MAFMSELAALLVIIVLSLAWAFGCAVMVYIMEKGKE
jgi:hypothetical protein